MTIINRGLAGRIRRWLVAQPPTHFGGNDVVRALGAKTKDRVAVVSALSREANPNGFPGLTTGTGRGVYTWDGGAALLADPEWGQTIRAVHAGLVLLTDVPLGGLPTNTFRLISNPDTAVRLRATKAKGWDGQAEWWVDPALALAEPAFGSAAIGNALGIPGDEVRAAFDSGAIPTVAEGANRKRKAAAHDILAWNASRRQGAILPLPLEEEAPDAEAPAAEASDLDAMADAYWTDFAAQQNGQPAPAQDAADGIYDVAVRTESGRLIVGYFAADAVDWKAGELLEVVGVTGPHS